MEDGAITVIAFVTVMVSRVSKVLVVENIDVVGSM